MYHRHKEETILPHTIKTQLGGQIHQLNVTTTSDIILKNNRWRHIFTLHYIKINQIMYYDGIYILLAYKKQMIINVLVACKP